VKKKRKPTPEEKRLDRIRKVNQRIGYERARGELESHYWAESRAEIDRYRQQSGMPFDRHEELCRKSRMSGYETGVLVGTENARTELREFYEKRRREYMAAHSPLAEPILSPWEMFCATNTINARGDS